MDSPKIKEKSLVIDQVNDLPHAKSALIEEQHL